MKLILDETAIGGRRYYLDAHGDIVDHTGALVPTHEASNVRFLSKLHA